MKKVLLFLFAVTILFVAVIRAQNADNTITDSRDGKTYKTIKIGKQIWMAENLNFAASNGSFCYNDSTSYCDKYGRLYKWETAKSVCPSGRHLPCKNEWQTLIDYSGGKKIAGGKLKSTSGWDSPNTGATNETGFSALPAGRGYYDASYNYFGHYGLWWSATENNATLAWYCFFYYSYADAILNLNNKSYAFAVRCLKDK